MGICAIYSRPFRQNNNFDDIWWCGWTDSPHSAFQNGPDLSIIKESRKGIFWPDVLLCVLAVAVWGDYVLSRNPTATRSIHNPHSASYIHHFYRACTIECSHNWLTAFKQYYQRIYELNSLRRSVHIENVVIQPFIAFGFLNSFRHLKYIST